jgi:hypothetical protein
VYYQPLAISAADLLLMRRIDELHLKLPFAGSRMLRNLLRQEGHKVGDKRVRTLMRRKGIEVIYRKTNTSIWSQSWTSARAKCWTCGSPTRCRVLQRVATRGDSLNLRRPLISTGKTV